ncbi:conserved hypothetical protein [Candidatus Terasakiella magnetica]|nr:conserved hypothetical protein [Candidatus Terasakiella magnetica]
MTRIGTLGSNNAYISRILEIQNRMDDAQLQVSTGLKAQSFSGIAEGANSLINFENEMDASVQFVKGNTLVSTRLTAATAAVTGVQATVKSFRDQLITLNQNGTKNQQSVEQIQKFAFQAMLDIQSYMGTNADGQYMFAGGRVSQDPVQLPAATLAGFQAVYDGSTYTYPTTRSAQLLDAKITKYDSTSLTFNRATGTLTAANAASLKDIAAGSTFSVASSVSNNTNFVARSHALTNVAGTPLAEGASAAGTFSYGSTPTNILAGAHGGLNFAFAANGNMKITPTTANSLSNLTVGTKFTINGSTGNAYDGAYKVVSNTNGVVEMATDTDVALNESVIQTLAPSTPMAVSLGGALQSIPAGNLAFTVTSNAGGTTVTLSGANFTGLGFAAGGGDQLTIGGTADHNGTFTTTAASATSVSFKINPDALRISKFLPQAIPRNDVTVSFKTGPIDAPITNTVTNAAYGTLTFDPVGTANGRELITASGGVNSFKDALGNPYPIVGQIISLSSTTGVNDGSYKVMVNSGGTLEVESIPITNETTALAEVSATSWYKGDTLTIQHRIDHDRQLNIGIYASDPGVEKALRALGMIAQGTYGTAGGLENNTSRITGALYLLNDALSSPAPGQSPFGTELTGDINTMQQNIGFVQKVISNKNSAHSAYQGFLDARIADISVADKTSAITALTMDSNALQASYQALGKVQSLSLLNYLK